MSSYYNDINEFCCSWLENLVTAGLISHGRVDCRSIHEISGEEVKGYTRCHFFAGIAGWDLALQLAGWPEDMPVWTGSCPCQPFSIAGRRKGVKDERHLWPKWKRLIEECLPPVIFGEQVASPLGRAWLDIVSSDLETLGYAVGVADLCAAGVGAPHIRQRLWFVAERLADAISYRSQRGVSRWPDTQWEIINGQVRRSSSTMWPSQTNGFWRATDWLLCKDEKWRPVEPGTFPLADGVPKRVGRLRAYGNAIVPQVAAIFIKAFMEMRGGDENVS